MSEPTAEELAEWLRAQLDEDEAKAQAAGGNWWFDQPAGLPDTYSLDFGRFLAPSVGFGDNDVLRPAEAEHIACHDPARVLAEVEVKHRLIDLAIALLETDPGMRAGRLMMQQIGKEQLQQLALPYAGRPGYRDEWRPV